MTTRRNFLRLGALFVPAAIVAPRVAYSFLWAKYHAGIDLAREGDETISIVVDWESGKILGFKRMAVIGGLIVTTEEPPPGPRTREVQLPFIRYRKALA